MKDYSNYTKEDLIDEIKNLQSRKTYGLNWEIEEENVVKEFKENFLYLKENEKLNISKDDNKPVNLIIEGDNYHAVSILNTTHKQSIDVIYIDPPYNTGNRDWRYNNDYVNKEHKYLINILKSINNIIYQYLFIQLKEINSNFSHNFIISIFKK